MTVIYMDVLVSFKAITLSLYTNEYPRQIPSTFQVLLEQAMAHKLQTPLLLSILAPSVN